jgi:hypothetical protein
MIDSTLDSFEGWKSDEFGYCRDLVRSRGDDNVGHGPATIATYLRLQAAQACRDGEYEISARLGSAATAINEDARNKHEPNWGHALRIMTITERE